MVGRLGKNDSLRMYLSEIVMVVRVMLNSLVVRRLKMSGLTMIGFLRSSCDMLSHNLLAVMLNSLAQLLFHTVFITHVVLVIIVLALELSNCVRIVMGFSGILRMENGVLLELRCLHIVSMVIVILLILFWVCNRSLGLWLLDFLLGFLVLGSGWFVRSHLVVETSWCLVYNRLMHLCWSFMLWLRIRLSWFWSRSWLLRMSLLVTLLPFFFEKLVVCFRLMITRLRHMKSCFV